MLRRAALVFCLVLALAVSSALIARSMTINSITIDGSFDDWENVLADPGNIVFDSSGASDPDLPGQRDRDIVRFATTWDDDNLYFYIRRSADPNMNTNFYFYIDVDNDGRLGDNDFILEYVINKDGLTNNGATGYRYRPSGGAGTTDPLGSDGVTVLGTKGTAVPAFRPTMDAANGPVGTYDSVSIEFKVAWSALGLTAGSPINIHAACGMNNIPNQIQDNVNGISTEFTRATLVPDRSGSAAPGETITYEHTLTHVGNVPDTFSLAATTLEEWPTLVTDTDGNTIDQVTLDNESVTVVVEVTVPAGIPSGSVGNTRLEATSELKSNVRAVVTDTTYAGLLSVYPNRTSTIAADTTIYYEHYIANNTEIALTVDLTAYSWSLWSVGVFDLDRSTPLSSVVVQPGEEVPVLLRVTSPPGASLGFVDISELRAVAQENPAYQHYARDITTVRLPVDIRPDRAASTVAGSLATYRHTVTNSLGSEQTINLAGVSSRGWNIRIFDETGVDEISELTLGQGESAEILVRVRVPIGATVGQTDTTTVTASLASDPTVFDTASDVTTVVRLATYSDPGFRMPDSVFRVGDVVYAQASGLTGAEKWFRWINPAGTTVRNTQSNVIFQQADSVYPTLETSPIGTWTVGFADTQAGALVASTPFTLTHDAIIALLYAPDAERPNQLVPIESILQNNGTTDITSSSLTYLVWYDVNGDGVFGVGDRYIDTHGQPQVYTSGTVWTHQDTDVTVPASDSLTYSWTLSNSDFIDWGVYNVDLVWETSDDVWIDEATDIFYSPGEAPGLALEKIWVDGGLEYQGLGSTVRFDIVLENDGDTDLVSIPLRDVYPSAYLEFAGASVTPSSAVSGELLWDTVGSLVAGETTTVTVEFTVIDEPPGNTTTNVASSSSALDAGGLSPRDVSDSAQIGIDVVPPLTTDDAPAAIQTTSPVYVTLTATDTVSGVDATYYRIDGGAALTYSTPIEISAEGTTTITYWSVDRAGNVEEVRTAIVRIDTIPPTVTIGSDPTEPDGSSGWFTTIPLASVDVDEPAVTWYSFASGGGPWTPYTTPVLIPAQGSTTVWAYAQDVAGNESAVVSRTFLVDTDAPITTDDAPVSWATADVSLTLDAFDAVSDVADTFYSIDGGTAVTYVGPVAISTEGTTTVAYWSVDVAGNVEVENTTTVRLDKTPPVTVLFGVPSTPTSETVTAVLLASDAVSGVDSTYYSVNGGLPSLYSDPLLFEAEGIYELQFWSVDIAGNAEGLQSVSFEIDLTPPAVDITGVEDAGLYNTSVTPEITITGATESTVTLNGAPYTSGTPITEEGTYTLVVTARDAAGNETVVTYTFEIDLTAPEVTITGVEDGSLYNEAVTPEITITGATESTVTLNGVPYVSGTPITEEGTYTLVVVATDAAGNETVVTYTFEIDLTAPEVMITGVEDGSLYNEAVTPVITITGATESTVTLNGELWVPQEITEEGTYTLVVTARDAAGNETTVTYTFTITLESTPLSIVVTGVENEGVYTTSVTPEITITGATESTVTLNGEPYTSGTPVTEPGSYELVVVASNDVAETITETVSFTISSPTVPTPLNLTATPRTTTILVTWDAVSTPDLAGYHLYRATSPDGPFALMTDTLLVGTKFEDVSVLTDVTYYYYVTAVSDSSVESAPSNVDQASVDREIVRLWGQDRTSTAARVSSSTFSSADVVIIATTRDFADALASSGLAGSYSAPLLLSDQGVLPAETRDEIVRLGARHAIIVGGPVAVSQNVQQTLESMGLQVTRHGGVNRYETAVLIAQAIEANETLLGRDFSAQIFLARGDLAPDSLSVSAYAYRLRAPVILTLPDALPAVTEDYVTGREFSSQLVAGGTDAVSKRVAEQLATAGRLASTRRGGTDRYATSVLIAEYAVEQGWASWAQVGLATGVGFADALTGGVAMGELEGVILVTSPMSLHSDVATSLEAHTTRIFSVRLFGGTDALSQQVENQVRAILEQ